MYSVPSVILTRFSRVTFNAAHKYLGLTKEVLKTEKAINEIACHPLPASFYEGGGLQSLRQRFDAMISYSPDPDEFLSTRGARPKSKAASVSSKSTVTGSPESMRVPLPTSNARQFVQAGDLHSSTVNPFDAFRTHSRSYSSFNTPRFSNPDGVESVRTEDFDLREEVMSCIAKSIGLLQPPLSGTDSVEASPAFAASEPTHETASGLFTPSFGSLSLLHMADDSSSVTASSSVADAGYMNGLDNEVVILFFGAGSTLVRAGERNTGLFATFWR